LTCDCALLPEGGAIAHDQRNAIGFIAERNTIISWTRNYEALVCNSGHISNEELPNIVFPFILAAPAIRQ
jgi:hypothetical protein